MARYNSSIPILLEVQGHRYTGWDGLNVSLGLEQASNSFSLTASDAGKVELAMHPIQLGARCRVILAGQPVINGWVEECEPSYDATTHDIKFSGRDVTCDAIDSSAQIPNQELHHVTLAEAATQLMQPYGITVDCPEPGATFEKFVVNDGETGFQAIENHAKQRGLIVYTLGDAVLHIRKPNPVKTGITLTEGVNILKASATLSHKERFGKYTVKSQSTGKHRASSEVVDKAVRSTRVMVVRAEKANDTTSNLARAQWEMRVRKAKSERASITVQGWHYAPDQLWLPNLLVNVDSPRLGLKGELLTASVALSVDSSGGSLTVLELVHPETYASEPVLDTAKK
jgi:prophage tail gpP-like protein